MMSRDLTSWVNERLEADERLSDDAKLLVLGALDGRAGLAEMAGYEPLPPEPKPEAAIEPVGAFIKQIKVHGFRGIGPEAQLDLDPTPSLTVISGRNGSGKSSFAEALEVALTGTTYRWRDRAAQWKEQWRNLHGGEPAHIEVTLAEENVGQTKLTVEWSADADLKDAQIWTQRPGEKRQGGIDSLGWGTPLEMYRPLLTYEELGALLTSEPKHLYDALSKILGLEQLSVAVTALADHQKTFSEPERVLRADKKSILDLLRGFDDERGDAAAMLLRARAPDTDELRKLATGTTGDTGMGAAFRGLLSLALPSERECADAAEAVRVAVERSARIGERVGEALERRSRLLIAAIDMYDHDGDLPCPVCLTGTLDAARSAALRAELENDRQELTELSTARGQRSAALGRARSLLEPVPAVLLAERWPDEVKVLVAELAVRWKDWFAVPDGDLALADHLMRTCGPARAVLDRLKPVAQEYLTDLDEAWSRIAARLAGYADAAEACEAAKPRAVATAAAYKWLKDNEILLKNERVEPIADQARKIWAGLRQEGNIEIGRVTLESSSTRRHVSITAEVDGQDAGALSVMSQGELHSLALALFLPRATMPASPFRFVVLDDPVQAMDPAKVDGLVGVLMEIARTRQVIVFSHDDRFASAVRRTPRDVPVKVLEVAREAGSRVSTVVTLSPARRYLGDAFGLVKDSGLPEDTLLRVLPGLLRMALEAQARDIYFGRALSKGCPHVEVEKRWGEASRTRERVALSLSDSSTVDAWLTRCRYRENALLHAKAIHSGLNGVDPLNACRDVEDTVNDLANGAR